MTPRPVAIPRIVPEIGLMAAVLSGFVALVHRFIRDGRLPQPFVYDVSDTFMDWFNTAYYAHNPGAFDVWRTVYPPLSFVFLHVFGQGECYRDSSFYARDCDTLGLVTIALSYLLCVVLAFLAFRKAVGRVAIPRGLAFALGLPLLYTLERGNLILVAFVCFAIAYGGLTRRRWLQGLAIALTINFKPYLLLPALAMAIKREWRALEVAGILSVQTYLLTMAALGSGTPMQLASNTADWVQNTGGLLWEQIYYSTSYAPFLDFDSYRFPTRDFVPGAIIEFLSFSIPIAVRSSQLMLLLCAAGAWLQPQALKLTRLSLLLLACSLIGRSPGGYAATFLVFLVFLEDWRRPGPIVAITAAYLACIPYDLMFGTFGILSGNSWLGGRVVDIPFGPSLGIFLRPGLVLAMFWGLAFDSLVLIVRAHRTRRPTVSPHPDVLAIPARPVTE